MDDTNYIAHLGGRLREIVVKCYISGLKDTYGRSFSLRKACENSNLSLVLSLAASLLAAFLGLFIRHHRL
jgi:hypothetical protein